MTHKGRVKQAELNAKSFYFVKKKKKKPLWQYLVSVTADTRLAHPSIFPTEILLVLGDMSPTHVVFMNLLCLE